MEVIVFILFFFLVLFSFFLGLKNYDGLNSGFLIGFILLIVFGFLLLDSGIQVQNGVLINRDGGGSIESVDVNYMNYSVETNGFVMVFAYLLPFFGFIGILLFLGHVALKTFGK
jgi:hypothetical protein